MTIDAPVRLGFVCVQNAGRSQMAAAFAERERDRRDWADRVEIITGGTHPQTKFIRSSSTRWRRSASTSRIERLERFRATN